MAVTTEKLSTASVVRLQALRFPVRPEQLAMPRFDETLVAMAVNLGAEVHGTEDVQTYMSEFLKTSSICFWLVLQDNVCVGYVAVGYPEGAKDGIQRGDNVALGWFILPDLRHKGLAGRAVDAILNYLKRIPVNSIAVDIDDDNEASLRLAAKYGFKSTGSGTWPDGRAWKSYVLVA